MCRLGKLDISSTASGSSDPEETVGPSYSSAFRTVFFSYTLYFFPYMHSSLLTVFLRFFCLISFLLFPCRVFGKTLVHEFHISYSHTEWYLFFSDSATTSAQCVFAAKNQKQLSTSIYHNIVEPHQQRNGQSIGVYGLMEQRVGKSCMFETRVQYTETKPASAKKTTIGALFIENSIN